LSEPLSAIAPEALGLQCLEQLATTVTLLTPALIEGLNDREELQILIESMQHLTEAKIHLE
jgi:hypothetical protein